MWKRPCSPAALQSAKATMHTLKPATAIQTLLLAASPQRPHTHVGTRPLPEPPSSPRLGSIWLSSRIAKISFCRKAALSSKPSLASAAMSRPFSSSARGLTFGGAWSAGGPKGYMGGKLSWVSAEMGQPLEVCGGRRGSGLHAGLETHVTCAPDAARPVVSPPPWCSRTCQTCGTARGSAPPPPRGRP